MEPLNPPPIMTDISPILITGAARRIGLHLTKRLINSGYRVIAHYRTAGEEVAQLEALGALPIQADFESTDDVLKMAEKIRTEHSSLRAIIHNASAYQPTSSDMESAVRQYHTFVAVHMIAPYILNESLREMLLASKDHCADILHIVDIYAERPNPDYDIYCSTKAALANLNKSFAKKFAPEIQVNAIAPGPVLFLGSHDDEYRKRVLAKTPLQIEGGPEAIYLMVKALLDNHYTTGVTVPVDGGRSLAE
ncbi:MAG: dihydromonapterin reductase [Sedimenticola sp.]